MSVADRIKQLLRHDPFLPFTLKLNSGECIRVRLPGEARLMPGMRWLLLMPMERSEEEFERRVDLTSIAEIKDSGQTIIQVGPMTIEKFDEFMRRTPFEPFTVHVADGSRIAVIGPEFVARTQGGRTIFVSTGGERTEWIDLLLVTRLSTGVDNPTAKESGAA